MRGGLPADEGGVPPSTCLDASLQRARIDGCEAETELVPARPFEVIQQGPGEIAPDRDTTLTRPREGLNVVAQEGDALLVVDLAGWRIHLAEGRAVLGYEERARMIRGVD